MRVLVSGGTGFIGKALVRELVGRGDTVTVLSRDTGAARDVLPRGVRVVRWDPRQDGPWCDEVGVVEAVVHLAGTPVMQRWTQKGKDAIVDSRVGSTEKLVAALGRSERKPSVFVCASATGYYGMDRGTEQLDEGAEPGNDFLSSVVTRWEDAAKAAEDHGVRSVQVRFGVVLGPGGGALEQMVLPGRLGVAIVGKGDNYLPWVHIDDVVGMMLLALDDASVSGAINCVSPYASTQAEVGEAAASVLGRPAIHAPTFAVQMRFGEAVNVLTGSLHVYPQRAVDLEYEFRRARLTPALEHALIE